MKYIKTNAPNKNKYLFIIIIFAVLFGIYRIPVVYNRVNSQWTELTTRITYFFNPPDEAIFVPQEQFQIALIVQATISAMTQVAEPVSTATLAPDQPTPVPTVTPTPLPRSVILDGITYVDQHFRWNYCGPANLTMALNYWGWEGDRDQVAAQIKPGKADPNLDFIQQGRSDVNVMPYEMSSYVRDHTSFNAVLRVGGNIDLIKSLISEGYPVLIEKGYFEETYTGEIAWLGHYLFVTGFDDQKSAFIVQDAYLKPGESIESNYEIFQEGWQSFNYTFIVVYPPENETEVFEILGDFSDENWANQHALDLANQNISRNPSGMEAYFSWFNKGSSHVALDQYYDAAIAYDYSFLLYNQLEGGDNQRPYRMMWYQVGPYWAYFHTQRYDDLINLATTTLDETISQPWLEESLFWRGKAYLAVGRYEDAVDDFKETVYLNPNYSPGISMLSILGEDLND